MHFSNSIAVFDRQTHLREIFRERLVGNLMLGGLAQHKLKDGYEHLGLFEVEALITTQLLDFLIVKWLPCNLLHYLDQDQLELDCTDTIENSDFSQDPLGAVNISAELEPHFK